MGRYSLLFGVFHVSKSHPEYLQLRFGFRYALRAVDNAYVLVYANMRSADNRNKNLSMDISKGMQLHLSHVHSSCCHMYTREKKDCTWNVMECVKTRRHSIRQVQHATAIGL